MNILSTNSRIIRYTLKIKMRQEILKEDKQKTMPT